MFVSQKCQYALRALFELALRTDGGPVKIAQIAKAQAIPARFLEVILSQLKQGGFVASQRGNDGGYELVRFPETLTVGEVMRFVEGPLGPVRCVGEVGKTGDSSCLLHGDCVFLPMWRRAHEALSGVYDNTTFKELVEQARDRAGGYTPSYAI